MSKNSQLQNRKLIIGGFFCLIVLIYLCRLFYIQVINDQYKLDAEKNAFRYMTEYPVRGYIYDRNGKLLVFAIFKTTGFALEGCCETPQRGASAG
jgi:penicillin-binding protein 2